MSKQKCHRRQECKKVDGPRAGRHGAVLVFYISFSPENRGFTDASLAFYMAAIVNAGSVLGRIAPNALSDRIGALNSMAPITLLLDVTVLCVLGVHNAAGMIVEAIVTGFFSGFVVALPPVCFCVLTANKSMIGTHIGKDFAIGGLGLLIGGSSAGAVLGPENHRIGRACGFMGV